MGELLGVLTFVFGHIGSHGVSFFDRSTDGTQLYTSILKNSFYPSLMVIAGLMWWWSWRSLLSHTLPCRIWFLISTCIVLLLSCTNLSWTLTTPETERPFIRAEDMLGLLISGSSSRHGIWSCTCPLSSPASLVSSLCSLPTGLSPISAILPSSAKSASLSSLLAAAILPFRLPLQYCCLFEQQRT